MTVPFERPEARMSTPAMRACGSFEVKTVNASGGWGAEAGAAAVQVIAAMQQTSSQRSVLTAAMLPQPRRRASEPVRDFQSRVVHHRTPEGSIAHESSANPVRPANSPDGVRREL